VNFLILRHIRNSRVSGFSLVELLIALTIFSVGVLGLYSIFPFAMKAVNQAENRFLANQIGQKEIEFLKTVSWDDLNNDNQEINSRPSTITTTTINGNSYSTTFNSIIRIDPLPDDPQIIKVARVQISWTTGSPRGPKFHHVDLETLINNPDQ